MRRRSGPVLALALVAAAGCASGPKDDGSAMEDRPPARPTSAAIDGLTAENNSARAAAMIVATWPPVDDPATRVEIDLQASLYRAAHRDNVGEITSHFLLEPLPESQMPPLAIPRRAFRLRVLAELADLGVPIAWTTIDTAPTPGSVSYPGTRELATRLRVSIVSRDPDDPDGLTVVADLADFTGHVGASRQRIEATWTDGVWELDRIGARTVW